MTLHVNATVSRKTPLDGRLEIPESLAHRLSDANGPLVVSLSGAESLVTVEAMACTCVKGQNGNHTHHFIAGEILKSLPSGANVSVAVDVDGGQVRIELIA